MEKLLKVLRGIRNSMSIFLLVTLGYVGIILLLFIKPVYIVTMKDLIISLTIAITLFILIALCSKCIDILKVTRRRNTIANIEILNANLKRGA